MQIQEFIKQLSEQESVYVGGEEIDTSDLIDSLEKLAKVFSKPDAGKSGGSGITKADVLEILEHFELQRLCKISKYKQKITDWAHRCFSSLKLQNQEKSKINS